MTKQKIDDILSLLTAVVIADKRIFADQIQAFLTQSEKLQISLKVTPKWSEAKTLMWFELNKDTVIKHVFGPDLKPWLFDRVNRLAHIKDKAAFLEAMRQIAIANGEVNVNEHALIVLIARQWALHPENDH